MLSRCGLDRNECFVTNIAHVRPPDNKFEWFLNPSPKIELVRGVVQLKSDLTEIKPNLIICLGTYPLRFVTGKIGIDKWRGSILESTLVPGIKTIGTYHPAAIFRIWDYKAVAEFDFARCKRESTTPTIRRPERNLILNPEREASRELVRGLLSADYLAIDIECFETPSGWKLACVGFADSGARAVTWPCDHEWQLDIIRELCQSYVRKVFQNGTFDVTVLRDNGIMVPMKTIYWDTMLGHHSLFAECAGGEDEMSALGGKKKQAAIKKGLAFQTSIYTDEPFYKDDGKLWKKEGDLNMFWRYNALDAAVTREIMDVQEQEIDKFEVRPVIEHEMRLVEPLMKMMWRGVKQDIPLREKLKENFEREIANLQAFLDKAAGGAVNVKSPKQMLDLLYNRLGLPAKYKRRTNKLTADKDAVNTLAGKFSHPVLSVILEIRQRRDFVERYLNAQVDLDGRMRCSFDITGTRSGRLSSRQSIYGSGTNLQNIPSRTPAGEAIRRTFIADEGMVFVYRDLSQAEARVVAHLAKCRALIELFEDPSRDIHRENAARIFNKPIEDVTDEERYLAKRVVHASNYGMGADKLVIIVNEDAKVTGVRIDEGQARKLIEKYFMIYPEIKENWWNRVEADLRHTRMLNTPFGRKRQFFGRWDDKMIREGYSYEPQSTVGWICNEGVINCYHEIEQKDKGELLLQVHDSILMQCTPANLDEVVAEMDRCMKIPVTIYGNTFTIPTDAKVGLNWGARPKKTPEDNPNGLVDYHVWRKERENGSN